MLSLSKHRGGFFSSLLSLVHAATCDTHSVTARRSRGRHSVRRAGSMSTDDDENAYAQRTFVDGSCLGFGAVSRSISSCPSSRKPAA